MSHFCVAVHIPAHNENLIQNIDQYLEQVMAPWHEYECTGIQNEYVKQIDVTEEAADDYMQTKNVFVKILPDGKKEYKHFYDFSEKEVKKRPLTEEEKILANEKRQYQLKDNEFSLGREKDNPFGEYTCALLLPEGYSKTIARICDMESFIEFIKDYYGISTIVDNMEEAPDVGAYMYVAPDSFFGPFDETMSEKDVQNQLSGKYRVFRYTNPNAKWDWWTTEGRFSFTDNEGNSRSLCKIKDIQTENPKRRHAAEKIWEYVIEKKEDSIDKQDVPMLLWGITEEDLARFPSKEAYVKDYCKWRPYAYIKDGIWHEPGEMGWWACSSSTPESQATYDEEFDDMLATCDPEDWFACVDCHI